MKKRVCIDLGSLFIYAICFLISIDFGFSQTIVQYDIKNLDEEQDIESLLFELEAANLNKDDVLKGKYNNLFKQANIAEVNQANKHFWLALNLFNSGDKASSLLIGTTKFDYINFYIGDTTHGFILTKGGLLCRNAEREIIDGPASFTRFQLGPKQGKLLLMEIKNIRKPNFDYSPVPIKIFKAESFFKRLNGKQKFLYFVLGAILLMALYNFFIYWIVKDSAYLYYVGYNLAFCTFVLVTEGGFIQKFLEDSYYQFTLVNHTGAIILM